LYFITKLSYSGSHFAHLRVVELLFEDCLVQTSRWMQYGTLLTILNYTEMIPRWYISSKPEVETLFARWESSKWSPRRIIPKEHVARDLASMMEVCGDGYHRDAESWHVKAQLQQRGWENARTSGEMRARLRCKQPISKRCSRL
jgi:hypothetical protein